MDFSQLAPKPEPVYQYDPYEDPRQPWEHSAGYYDQLFFGPLAANAEWSFTCPGDRWLVFLSIRANYFTSAVVATRRPKIQYKDGNGNIIFEAPATQNATAGGSTFFAWAVNYGTSIADGSGTGASPLPSIIMQPGFVIGTRTSSKDSGDNYIGIACQVLVYPNRPRRRTLQHGRPWLPPPAA